jgi:hypothetical protein
MKLQITKVGSNYVVGTLTITPAIVLEMRNWAMECEWLDSDSLDEYSDITIISGVSRHFDGGVFGFLLGCAENAPVIVSSRE